MISPGGVDLTNTPGIYYGFAYWLGGMLYIHVNKKRFHGWKLLALQALFLLTIVGFMVMTDFVPVALFLPCVVGVVLLIYGFIRACCDLPPSKALYFCMRAFILGEFAASLEWQLFYYGLTVWKLPLHMGVNLLFVGVSHTLVFGIMFLLERRHRGDNDTLQISTKESVAVVLLCAVVYATSNLSYAFKATPFSSEFPHEIFIIRTFVDFAGLGILFAYHMQLREMNARIEKEFLKKMLHMQYTNYQLSEESIALVNQKYHDLKHQIELLRSEVQSEQKTEYLDQMAEELKAYEAQNKTGSKVLDTILAARTLQCQSLGITLTCVADGAELAFMHPMDLSALFGNALDNAVESVKRIADVDRRLIHISVVRQKNFLRIRVENYYEGKIAFTNGVPTTKRDPRFHGYGMKSIRKTVEKYNGSITIDTQNGWFELRILLPCGEAVVTETETAEG